jgi:predicted enzyme related to lactoylglutathione lyase
MLNVHVYVEVADLERGIAFYCGALDLTLKRRLRPGWVELAGADVPVFLLGDRTPTVNLGSRTVPRSFDRHWTPVHLDFIVSDLERSVERCRGHGASLECEIQVREWGRMANMADPFGNGFDLIEMGPRGYDAVQTG